MNHSKKEPGLGVSASRLALAYHELFPGEFELRNLPEVQGTMQNWLDRFHQEPEKAIATTNWAGKVTQALFYALGLDTPKTKKAMLELLSNPPQAVRIVEYELDYKHRVQVAVPSVSYEDAVAQAEEAFDQGTIWDNTQAMPVLFDDFEESEGNTLVFRVVDTVAGMQDLPPKDASVKVIEQQNAARQACSLLLQAVETAKQSGKNAISFANLSAAIDAATAANPGDQQPVKVLVEVEGGVCIGTYATLPIEVVVMDADKAKYGEDVSRMIDFPDGISARTSLSRNETMVEPEFVREVFAMKGAA